LTELYWGKEKGENQIRLSRPWKGVIGNLRSRVKKGEKFPKKKRLLEEANVQKKKGRRHGEYLHGGSAKSR